MAEWYQVKAKVISQKGTCSAGHKAGDEFIIRDTVPDGDVCLGILYAVPVCLRFTIGRFLPLGERPGQSHRRLPGRGKPAGFSINPGKKYSGFKCQ